MNHKHYMVVSKLFFTIVAFMHLLRAILGWELIIGNYMVPVWISWVVFIIAGVLALSAERMGKK